jgi:hypothetical protein
VALRPRDDKSGSVIPHCALLFEKDRVTDVTCPAGVDIENVACQYNNVRYEGGHIAT